MSMMALQTVIAALCLDARFRQAFLNDPEAALVPFDLLAVERRALRELDLRAVEQYADALLAKRRNLLKQWFPLSLSVLERAWAAERVNEHLWRYGLENVPHSDALGGGWVRDEIGRFYQYLLHHVSACPGDAPYLKDVLMFEMVKLSMLNDPEVSRSARAFAAAQAARPALTRAFRTRCRPLLGRHVRVHAFQFDMARLLSQVESRPSDVRPEAEPVWVLFSKQPQAAEIRTRTIGRALKDLLELCDGTQTVARTLAQAAPRWAADAGVRGAEAESAGLECLIRLYEEGIITFTRGAGTQNPVSAASRKDPFTPDVSICADTHTGA